MSNSKLIEAIHASLVELDVEAEIQAAPAPLAGDHVVATMPADSSDEPWVFNFTPYPGLKDEIEDADVVQLMVVLPFQAEPAIYPDVARLLLNVNNKTAVGNFALRESDGLIFYKNTLILPHEDPKVPTVIQNAFFLGGFLIEHFSNAIEMVVVGQGSLADARDLRPELDEFRG